MKNFVNILKKSLALLISLTFMTKATTTVIYNGAGNTPNEYFEFTEKEASDAYLLTKVSVKNKTFETQDVTLQIPGGINGKKIKLWAHSFKNFGMNNNENMTELKVKLQFLKTNDLGCQMPEDCKNLFEHAVALTDVDFHNIDNDATVTTMCGMFKLCTNLNSIDFGDLNTGNVHCMEGLFCECSNLIKINFRKFDTSSVLNMANMFLNCSKLTDLDLSNFNVSNVLDMSHMFYNMQHLCNLNLSNFNTTNVGRMDSMFCQCEQLVILDLSSFNFLNIYSTDMMFKGCISLTHIRFGKSIPQFRPNAFSRTCSLVSALKYIDLPAIS